MTMTSDHVDDLMILLEVAEAGGFSAASRITGRSKSLMSRRVKDLELDLGVSLLVRDSRRFDITPVGKRLIEHAVKIRSEALDAFSFAAHILEGPTGVLRVACPARLAEMMVGPLAIDLATTHPQLELKISTFSGRASDHEAQTDIVILPSFGALKDADVIARKLGECQYVNVAAPEISERFRQACRPKDLEGMPAIGWSFHNTPSSWVFQHQSGAREIVGVDVRFEADTLSLVNDAAVRGLGAAQLPVAACKKDLLSGALCLLLNDWRPPSVTMYAVYPSRRSLTPAGRLFLDLLSQRFSTVQS